jgi:hypothetical protein
MFQDSLSKIILWILFLILFYNLLIKIITFIGIDEYLSKMYIYWFIVILLFISVLSTNKIDLNI